MTVRPTRLPAPFQCVYNPQLPELLQQLQCTIALSTYQAGKVILLSCLDGERLIQLPRTFDKPMGIALRGDQMALATRNQVHLLTNSPGLAAHYPAKPATYDALFMPRATYYTGQIDIHDLEWGQEGLIAVNTSFSCLCRIDEHYSFTPIWHPPFISHLAHEDRCHLNGLAMEDGRPRFVTAFNQGDSRQSWRDHITKTGVLLDVASGEPVCTGLPMPHSPRIREGQLFVLLSATGELVCIDQNTGKVDVVTQLDGFVRGMDTCGDYAFIGLSRLRPNSSTFAKLPMAHRAQQAGIVVVHVPTGAVVGQIRYQSSVDEIYDVRILPGLQRPNILNTDREEHQLGLAIPERTYWAQPRKKNPE